MPIDDALEDIKKKERFLDKIKNERAREFYEAEKYLDNGRKIRELKARENEVHIQNFHDEISCGYGFVNLNGILRDMDLRSSAKFDEVHSTVPFIDIIRTFDYGSGKGELDLQISLGYLEFRTHRNDDDYANKIYDNIAKLEGLAWNFTRDIKGNVYKNRNEFLEMAKNARTPEEIETILKLEEEKERIERAKGSPLNPIFTNF